MVAFRLFGQQKTQLTYNNGSADVIFEFDAVVNEGHSGEADVTQKPVEDGSILTDHVRVRPQTLTIEGAVSNFPVQSFISDIVDLIIQPDDFLSQESDERRMQKAIEELRAMQQGAYDVTVLTELETYPQMVLQSFTTDRNAEFANSVVFSMSFIRVKRVQVEIKGDPTQPRRLRGSKKKEKGPGATVPANQAQVDKAAAQAPEKKTSFAVDLFG